MHYWGVQVHTPLGPVAGNFCFFKNLMKTEVHGNKVAFAEKGLNPNVDIIVYPNNAQISTLRGTQEDTIFYVT